MGTRTRPSTPDLFPLAPTREAHSRSSEPSGSLPATIDTTPSTNPSRHILPGDLQKAVGHLDDHELLLSAVIAEQKRRGKRLAPKISELRRVEVVRPLTQEKLNAVHAASKAGIMPSGIARQFAISQSERSCIPVMTPAPMVSTLSACATSNLQG